MVALAMYEPTPTDIDWAKNMVRMLRDDAVWQVPMNGATYQINHKAKEFALTRGPLDDIFDKSVAVFARVGYKVVDRRQMDYGSGKTTHK